MTQGKEPLIVADHGYDWSRNIGPGPGRLVATLGVVVAAAILAACSSGSAATVSSQAKAVVPLPGSVVVTSQVVTTATSATSAIAATAAPTLFRSAPSKSATTPLPSTSSTPSVAATADSPMATSSSATAAPLSRPSIEKSVCALVFPKVPVPGGHCHFPDLKVSNVDPNWVWARGGIYNDQNQARSDTAQVVVDLTTRKVVGPTNVGFCGVDDPAATRPIDGYSSIPSGILLSLGLTPCASPAASSTHLSSTKSIGPAAITPFVGVWGAHQTSLTVAADGTGELRYADIARCADCAAANAPLGTLVFVLRTVTNGVGAGSVTSSSNPQNWAIGDSVVVTIVPGSPGRLLDVRIAGKELLPFCNDSSIGQCGA